MVSVNGVKQVVNLFVHNPMRFARKPEVVQMFAEDIGTKLKYAPALKGDVITLSPQAKKAAQRSKYLQEHCNIYKEPFKKGCYTVVETKNGVVDFHMLGELDTGTTIIRYNTPEQARQGAISRIMKQFEVPKGEQMELCIATKGRDLYLDYECFPGIASRPAIADPSNHIKGEVDLFHNHPSFNHVGDTVPLSGNDIFGTIWRQNKSITAINEAGELNTATIIDLDKAFGNNAIDATVRISTAITNEFKILYMGKDGKRLLKLRELKKNKKLSSRLAKELSSLEKKFKNFNFSTDIDKMIYEKYPTKYSEILHKVYRKILPQFGIEYSTNFTNLAKI